MPQKSLANEKVITYIYLLLPYRLWKCRDYADFRFRAHRIELL